MKQLDFREEKVQVLNIVDLEHTYHENLVDGTPVNGIYHYVLLQQILALAEEAGLKPEVREVFAANNRDSMRPGVTVLPQLEAQYGERALEAHLLRRVYANIALRADETDEVVTNLAVAYHQKGIQIGIGPMVKVCHNQTILHHEDVVSTYSCWGRTGVMGVYRDLQGVFNKVQSWFRKYQECNDRRAIRIKTMMQTDFDQKDLLMLLGQLQIMRVCADSREKGLRDRYPTYALNGAQINLATENYLKGWQGEDFSYWEAYQYFNSLLKPKTCDVPQILPQSLHLAQVMLMIRDIKLYPSHD